MNLDLYIKKVPDFPKKGILFYDITSLLLSSEAVRWVIEAFSIYLQDKKIDKIVGIDARGFIFSALLADKLDVPLVLARKQGKLPRRVYRQDYQLEYGSANLEIHQEDIKRGENIVIVDDLIATGGTIKATISLLEQRFQAVVSAVVCVIGLPFLNYSKLLAPHEVHALLHYDSE